MKKTIIAFTAIILIMVTGFAADLLSVSETEGILLMREEEKLARDVYLKLYEMWGINTFANIARSEQNHMDQVGSLLLKYDLNDPAKEEPGEFTSELLQNLYNELVETGSLSAAAAIQIGLKIEELDIRDLEELIEQTENPDLEFVYQNLLDGSENHLRAFDSQLRRFTGETYAYEYISEERAAQILSGTNGRGKGK